MDRSTYLAGVAELYAAEILGEAPVTRGLSWAAAHRPTGPRSPTKRLPARSLQRPTAAAHGRGLPGLVDHGFKSCSEASLKPWSGGES
jgi:hypothetical protein